DQAAALVERHPRPVVGRAAVLPRVLRPRAVAELSGMRDGVEGPPKRAAPDVVGADVAWGCGQAFADTATHDHEILVDHAGRREPDALRLRIAAEILPQVDVPVSPERGDRVPGRLIERGD